VDEPVLMNASKKTALEVLQTLGPAASGVWRKAVEEARSINVSRKTFDNWRSDLLEGGFVESLVADKHRYQVTAKGRAVISIVAPSETNGKNQMESAACAPPYRGGRAARGWQRRGGHGRRRYLGALRTTAH